MLKRRKSLIKRVDLIVVGAGLAGAAVAWTAHWQGMSVFVVDRGEPDSSSRVAAGLVTPITGSRAAASWRWSEFYPSADVFYRRMESETSSSVWKVAPALRLFRDEQERDLYDTKWPDAASPNLPHSIRVARNSEATLDGFKMPHGFCSFFPAARLMTIDYLQATHRHFELRQSFVMADLRCDQDIDVAASGTEYPIHIPQLGVQGKNLVFCQGVAAHENRYFANLPLHPARGDILTIESKLASCDRILHHDSWVVPLGERQFLLGATYQRTPFRSDKNRETSRDDKDDKDNEENAIRFRSELMRRWETMTTGDFASGDHLVIDQRWATRPASYDRHPLIGPHGAMPNIYCLNGLGSKGSLLAPHLAEMLIASMRGGIIDSSLHISRRK